MEISSCPAADLSTAAGTTATPCGGVWYDRAETAASVDTSLFFLLKNLKLTHRIRNNMKQRREMILELPWWQWNDISAVSFSLCQWRVFSLSLFFKKTNSELVIIRHSFLFYSFSFSVVTDIFIHSHRNCINTEIHFIIIIIEDSLCGFV